MSEEEDTIDVVCAVCGEDDDEELLCLCELCPRAFHTYCMKGCSCGFCKKKPNIFGKVPEIPEGDWFCKFCSDRPPKFDNTLNNKETIVYAFGCNEAGQLGLGYEGKNCAQALTVVEDLKGLSVDSMALGGWSSILVTDDGLVYTCGDGENGKLGMADFGQHEFLNHFRLVSVLHPDNLTGNSGSIVSVAVGRAFMIAASSEGHLYTWGESEYGQLGHQDNKNKKTPKKISALRELEIDINPNILACGWYHFLVVTDDGEIMSCGENRVGQLGSGDTRSSWIPKLLNPRNSPSFSSSSLVHPIGPEPFSLGYNVVNIACGSRHTLCLTSHGELFAFGGGSLGQLGIRELNQDETKSAAGIGFRRVNLNSLRPERVLFGQRTVIMDISAGADHNLAISDEGKLYSWGVNTHGQLCLGDTTNRYIPTLVPFPSQQQSNIDVATETKSETTEEEETIEITDIGTGDSHSMILSHDGEVWVCGKGEEGQLGLGHFESRSTLTKLDMLPPIAKIFCGGNHNFLLAAEPLPLRGKRKSKNQSGRLASKSQRTE